jgi:protein SCO1/2
MKWILYLAFLFPLFCVANDPASSSLSDQSLARIRFDQKPGSQISMSLPFRDETGKTVKIRDFFGRNLAILILGYYQCPMLCTMVNDGLIEALQDLKLDVGKQFDVINITINPRETSFRGKVLSEGIGRRFAERHCL